MAKRSSGYSKGRKCCICGGDDTYITNSGTPLWYVCKCGRESCAGWLCHKHYTRQKSHSPGGYIDTIKSIMDIRIDNIKIDSDNGRYIMSQAVTAKTLNTEDLNISMDNFKLDIDMKHEKYMKIDVKCSSLWYRGYREMWTYSINRKIDCDTYFLLGFNPSHKHIEDVRIIPNEGWIRNLMTITIVRNQLKTSKFDQFKVSNDIYNENFHDLLSYIGNKNYFGIKDIKKWLENGRNENKEEKLNDVKVEGDVNNGIEGRTKKEIQTEGTA